MQKGSVALHFAQQRQLAVTSFHLFVLLGRHLAGQVTVARWQQPLLEVALDGEGHLTATWRSLSHRGKCPSMARGNLMTVSSGGARER